MPREAPPYTAVLGCRLMTIIESARKTESRGLRQARRFNSNQETAEAFWLMLEPENEFILNELGIGCEWRAIMPDGCLDVVARLSDEQLRKLGPYWGIIIWGPNA